MSIVLVVTTGCGPSIDDEPPIPEHRIEPCETWCGMMFDPVCPATEVEVETEEACIQGCTQDETRWGRDGEEDVCAPTYIPFVDCLASLPCDELQQHFDLINEVPTGQLSPCGGLQQEQLDCQLPYQ